MDLLKPYVLVACVAFTIGFVGYWALGRALTAPAMAQDGWSAPVSAPVVSAPIADDRLDAGKHI